VSELPVVAVWQQVTHRLLAALDEELSDFGLSAAEINALACFGGEESRTVRQLVAATAQRPSTLTGVLDRLERRGLIERTPESRRPPLGPRPPHAVRPRGRRACRQRVCSPRAPAAGRRRPAPTRRPRRSV
jgi:DNA-binding MarR family transcriptional regulator